jgi:hypothetical protein
VNVGDGKPDTGRDGSLPRAGAVKDRVNRAVGRLASLSRIENRMQLVGRPDQLGCPPLLTGEVAGRGRELWIWLILLAGGCPRGIGELVDELHHPAQLDLQNKEHTRQCNVVKALMPLQLPAGGARVPALLPGHHRPVAQHPVTAQMTLPTPWPGSRVTGRAGWPVATPGIARDVRPQVSGGNGSQAIAVIWGRVCSPRRSRLVATGRAGRKIRRLRPLSSVGRASPW